MNSRKEKMGKPGKSCPSGHTVLDELYSQNMYFCCECNKFYPNKLKPKQKSILNDGMTGEKEGMIRAG